MPDINKNADLTDKAVAWDAIAEKNAVIASQAAEIARLREGLRFASCPRPANHRPDEFDIGDCFDAGECGCFAATALQDGESGNG